jgi:hypothetical protein
MSNYPPVVYPSIYGQPPVIAQGQEVIARYSQPYGALANAHPNVDVARYGTAGPQMYPGQSNTYVKDHAASNYLITQFSRNVKDFPLNRYIQYQDTSKDTGYYLRLNVEQAGRLKGGTLDKYYWPDGADRPRPHDETEKFNWVDFRCHRYDFPFQLGWKSRDQAGFDLQDVELANKAQQSMTGRTLRVHNILSNNANWDATHVIDVVTIPGNTGRWDQSTTGRSDIKRSINYAVNRIRLDTLAVVKQKSDMILVMNPFTAQRIGESQEMISAFIQSRFAMGQFVGEESTYDDYGLPTKLYGIEVVVEDTVMVTSAREAATVTRADVCQNGTVYLLSRPGGLVSKTNNGPNFSTINEFSLYIQRVEHRNGSGC